MTHFFQRWLVADHQCGALYLQQLLLLKIREQAAHSLASRADHLRDFLVCECYLHLEWVAYLSFPRLPGKKQFCKLLRGGTGEAQGADFFLGCVVITTQLLRNTQCDLAILSQKLQQRITRDEVSLP